MSNATLSLLDHPYEIEIPCIRVTQPIGTFYIAALDAKTLCEITYSDVRRMAGDREFETYLGIQRPLNKNRVKEIQEYVRTTDACFPTAVILAVQGRCAEYRGETNTLVLRNYFDEQEPSQNVARVEIAKVLDGQHRIEGLREFDQGQFDVNVSIFVDMDVENQAYVFSTVNLAQTKVNKSLVYDLFEYAKARSPQKTCHKIAVALDSHKEGPLYQRIKRLGVATEGRFTETLTQATFVESLLPYLTANKVTDRDTYLRGRTPPKVNNEQSHKLIFRNLFLDERDFDIADIITNYFQAVAERWPEAWNQNSQGRILNKTNGFKALMRLLRPAYLRISSPGSVPSREDFSMLFSKAYMSDHDFTVDNFKPGTSGQTELYSRLMEELQLQSA